MTNNTERDGNAPENIGTYSWGLNFTECAKWTAENDVHKSDPKSRAEKEETMVQKSNESYIDAETCEN